jgi:hypothetical protein
VYVKDNVGFDGPRRPRDFPWTDRVAESAPAEFNRKTRSRRSCGMGSLPTGVIGRKSMLPVPHTYSCASENALNSKTLSVFTIYVGACFCPGMRYRARNTHEICMRLIREHYEQASQRSMSHIFPCPDGSGQG